MKHEFPWIIWRRNWSFCLCVVRCGQLEQRGLLLSTRHLIICGVRWYTHVRLERDISNEFRITSLEGMLFVLGFWTSCFLLPRPCFEVFVNREPSTKEVWSQLGIEISPSRSHFHFMVNIALLLLFEGIYRGRVIHQPQTCPARCILDADVAAGDSARLN